jgi:hypothetical protein
MLSASCLSAPRVSTSRSGLSSSVRPDFWLSTPLPLWGRAKRAGLTAQNQDQTIETRLCVKQSFHQSRSRQKPLRHNARVAP